MRKIVIAGLALATASAPGTLGACAEADTPPKASPTSSTVSSTASSAAPGPTTPGKPTVTLYRDPERATKELRRLRATGWWNPNKIEYSDDPVTALKQFKYWLDKDYIAPDGGWSPKGRRDKAWLDTGYERL
ncbi:hypothetical protein [Spirillospora sp. CA-294931]|uniref:hypothetical protein n=1 Tax=Spirillospora sp. CA-294931 TaxID=3240042 RepID=UPI003D926FCA